VPVDKAERGKDVVSAACGGGEVLLADWAVIVRFDPPNIESSAPKPNRISIC
jgi:hypothetical protein